MAIILMPWAKPDILFATNSSPMARLFLKGFLFAGRNYGIFVAQLAIASLQMLGVMFQSQTGYNIATRRSLAAATRGYRQFANGS